MIIDLAAMRSDLERDEDRKSYLYKDSLGLWTIGCGRLVDKDKDKALTNKDAFLSEDEMDLMENNDITKCLSDIESEPWMLACDTDGRRRALVNMRFQLGPAGLRSFKNSLSMIQQRRWKDAATNLRQSIWYTQTPARAERVIRLIENG